MKYMVLFDDYTGLPRAWAYSEDRQKAEEVARRHLAKYCKKNEGLEPNLADPNNYTMRVEELPD